MSKLLRALRQYTDGSVWFLRFDAEEKAVFVFAVILFDLTFYEKEPLFGKQYRILNLETRNISVADQLKELPITTFSKFS
jgi:hypothetical protein